MEHGLAALRVAEAVIKALDSTSGLDYYRLRLLPTMGNSE
jgi:hypothetical protein